MPPYHDVQESPTVAIRRDIELAQWLDRLGYDEVWFGEHHSGGFEIFGSPELMIAAVAEVTRRIRLGTGVISLPYHNPLMVANRIIQLDHMTMGRVMMGVGPGLLPVDATMQGIDVSKQRDMMVESLEVILRLLRGETVTAKTSWFTLDKAKLHLLPYTHPHPEVAVASSVTPSGGMLAGRLGLSMLCVAATEASGFETLSKNWEIATKIAAENGRRMSAERLRLVAPMHIAETREKARENVRFGLKRWCEYFDRQAPKGYGAGLGALADPAEALVRDGRAVIGTPADAIAMIERLFDRQGEFGCLLISATDWADWEATKKSYELFARFVMPHFAGANRHRQESFDRAVEEIGVVSTARQAGIDAAFAKWTDHEHQQGSSKSR